MDNLYVIVHSDHTARLYQAITDELDNAKYHLYDYLKENVRHRSYNSIEEIEAMFEDYTKSGVFHDWAKIIID